MVIIILFQVRKRPLNKREMSKKEEDIISIVPNSNYLTVHETKLKVSVWWDVFLDIACYRCNIKLECLSCVDFMLLLCDHFSVSSTLQ